LRSDDRKSDVLVRGIVFDGVARACAEKLDVLIKK
jgi:hypothetical protein